MKRSLRTCIAAIGLSACLGSFAFAGTPEIIIDGVVVQETSEPAILESLAKMDAYVKEDTRNGHAWIYSNAGNRTRETFREAVAGGYRCCNCAMLARWALYDAGVVPERSAFFYGLKGGGIKVSESAYAMLTSACDIYTIGGKKTVNEMIADGSLQPGDIVTYQDFGHTNIYAGDNHFYDAGHGTVGRNVDGLGFVFAGFYVENRVGSCRVGNVIRVRSSGQTDAIQVSDLELPDIVITDILTDDFSAYAPSTSGVRDIVLEPDGSEYEVRAEAY